MTNGEGSLLALALLALVDAVPVDPAIRTTHMGHGIFECALLTGT
jgi:hypothetical protein